MPNGVFLLTNNFQINMAIKQATSHPKQHSITLELSNGEKIKLMTTLGKEGDVLKADIDPFNHPAWQEDGNKNFVNANSERIAKFNKKFGGFSTLAEPESEGA